MTAVATPVSAFPSLHMAPVPLSIPKPSSSPSLAGSPTDSAHGDDDGGASQKTRISAFVRKLRSMIDNDSVHHIHWTADGEAFRVVDSVTFSRDVLPNYFKHNNWQSFIRQLNIYGFVKLTDQPPHATGSGFTAPPTPQLEWTFKHPLFLRHAPDSMEDIKRRTPKTSKSAETDEANGSKKAKAANAKSGPKAPASPQSSRSSKSSVASASRARLNPGNPPGLPLFPGLQFHGAGMAAAAAAAMAAGISPAAAAAVLGASGQPVRPPMHPSSHAGNPSMAMPSAVGNSGLGSMPPPLANNMMMPSHVGPGPNAHQGNASAGTSCSTGTSTSASAPKQKFASKQIRSTASSVSSTSSGATLAARPSDQMEAERLRNEMSAMQTRMEALRRHMQDMDGIQARAMSHMMQVLSTQARNDCPLSTVTELQDCLDTWRHMSEVTASLLPTEVSPKDVENHIPDEQLSGWDSQPANPLFLDAGVEPTMLLLHDTSLIDPPPMTMTAEDAYDLSFDDSATLSGDECKDDAGPPAKRRRSK